MTARAPAAALPATFADRVAGALWGIHIGDALAMPAHWFYGGNRQIKSAYGGDIKGYVKPITDLSGSIMNLSNTGGAGRGGFDGDIVGSVINHGKKAYWERGRSCHYHCTLQAGEGTLEMSIVRECYNCMTANGGTLSAQMLLDRYIEFMTTPGSHNDCYASTYHRMFFSNRRRGLPLEQCPDNDGHNVDTQDGLTITIPVALATATQPQAEAERAVADSAQILRKSAACGRYGVLLGRMLRDLLSDKSLADVLESAAGQSLERTLQSQDPVVA
jgi:ADP-ribosylglycohydrolase